ncbi:MAG: acyl-CoA thioesterase II, partial [Saprospiraceae bacterium]|nr:acyl-CoA thioesterase II [Bacteroidia bacterium]NNE15497.1 acyl-CoA thioesterase II [Saprospiraceae bacterium]NNL93144.1 acyl-CoA thioesterase II [Saprospiraceae bacterium]
MQSLDELLDLLSLNPLGDNKFEGQNFRTPWKRVFGGQVLGQSLHAAYKTVPEDRYAHSLHGYFILPGDVDIPIIYEVDEIRDGGSFTTRRVVAKQNGVTIFIAAASFQLRQEGLDHQINMPNVVSPEVLLTDAQQLEEIKDVYPELYKRLTSSLTKALEFRPVEQVLSKDLKNIAPYRHVWMRSEEDISLPLSTHHEILAFASDYNLLGTALLPHRESVSHAQYFIASLDHAIWFHRDFNIHDWLLVAMDSPSASNSRALSRGNIFNREGKLIASIAQEGLIRV